MKFSKFLLDSKLIIDYNVKKRYTEEKDLCIAKIVEDIFQIIVTSVHTATNPQNQGLLTHLLIKATPTQQAQANQKLLSVF